jgi:hypothetical protein
MALLLLALPAAAAAELIPDPLERVPSVVSKLSTMTGLAIGPTGTAYLGVRGGMIALRDRQ